MSRRASRDMRISASRATAPFCVDATVVSRSSSGGGLRGMAGTSGERCELGWMD